MKRYLVLYRHPTGTPIRPAIDAHLRSLERAIRSAGSGDRVVYHNAYDEAPPRWLRAVEVDAVVLHTTFLCMRWSDHFGLFAWRYRWIADAPCVKVAIPQDEYDHSEVLDEWLSALGVTCVLSNFDTSVRSLIYPRLSALGVAFDEVLTGYIDAEMARRAARLWRPPSERQVDIVYRASNLPAWFGAHGQLKHRIGEIVGLRAKELGLRTDISTRYEDVIYGDAWTDFLLSGRAVLGTESGSSVLDRRGEIQAAVRALLASDPDLTFDELDARLPLGWDGTPMGAISPRHFEAVATRTCQVLTEGRYSGILDPSRHYFALRRDFSNLDEVLELVQDEALAAERAEAAYADIYESGRYSYDTFGNRLLEILSQGPSGRAVGRMMAPALERVGPQVDRALGVALRITPELDPKRVGSAIRTRLERIGMPGANRRPLADSVLSVAVAVRARSSSSGRGASARGSRLGQLGRLGLLTAGALRDPGVRALLVRYVGRGWWLTLSPRALASDLVRAGIAMREAALAEVGENARVSGSLIWTRSLGREAPIDPRHPRRGTIAIGSDGTYEFRALTELARRHPRAAERLGG